MKIIRVNSVIILSELNNSLQQFYKLQPFRLSLSQTDAN